LPVAQAQQMFLQRFHEIEKLREAGNNPAGKRAKA
jgi:hypothetical protein